METLRSSSQAANEIVKRLPTTSIRTVGDVGFGGSQMRMFCVVSNKLNKGVATDPLIRYQVYLLEAE